MSKSSRLYKIFMASIIVVIVGFLLATGIIAIQKSMKINLSFQATPNYFFEVYIQKQGEETTNLVFRNFEKSASEGVVMENGFSTLYGNTLTADDSFFETYGNEFELIIKNYTKDIGLRVSVSVSAEIEGGHEGVLPTITENKMTATKFEEGAPADYISFGVSATAVFPQTTVLNIAFKECIEYAVVVTPSSGNFIFSDTTNKIARSGENYIAIVKAGTGYKLEITVTRNDGTTTLLIADNDYVWESDTGELTIYANAVIGDITIACATTAITYAVVYNANGGSGAMASSSHTYNVEKTLTKNTFTAPTSYVFDGWNTKADGSGSKFTDGQAVKNLGSENGEVVTLYAQWGPMLIAGQTFNTTIKAINNSSSGLTYETEDSSITSITLDTWNSNYASSLGVWDNNASAIDVSLAGDGSIKLFAVDDNTDSVKEKIYVLSKRTIFANESCYGAFAYFPNVTQILLTNFNTSQTTTMGEMFAADYLLESLDVSKFDTSKNTSLYATFYMCQSLETLNLENFVTDKVTDMSFMFYKTFALKNLNVKSFETRNVTNMYCMLSRTGLESVDLSSFNTSKVENFNSTFYDNPNLKVLDLSSFDTSSATDMGSMFGLCSNLTTIYASESWNTAKVTYSSSMFYNCSSLVGWDGTKYSSSYTDKTKAHYNSGGYLTYKGVNYYTVILDANDGSGESAAYYHSYDVETVLTNPFTKTGYTVSNWNTKADGAGTGYADGAKVKNLTTRCGTITLYAQWTLQTYYIYSNINGISTPIGTYTMNRTNSQTKTVSYQTASGFTSLNGWCAPTANDAWTISGTTLTIPANHTGDITLYPLGYTILKYGASGAVAAPNTGWTDYHYIIFNGAEYYNDSGTNRAQRWIIIGAGSSKQSSYLTSSQVPSTAKTKSNSELSANYVLLLSEVVLETTYFDKSDQTGYDGTQNANWSTSTLDYWLNKTYWTASGLSNYTNKIIAQNSLVSAWLGGGGITTNTTASNTAYDHKIFLLASKYGYVSSSGTTPEASGEARNYTQYTADQKFTAEDYLGSYNLSTGASSNPRLFSFSGANSIYWWLRSGRYSSGNSAYIVRNLGYVDYNRVHLSYGVRPSFVFNLA